MAPYFLFVGSLLAGFAASAIATPAIQSLADIQTAAADWLRGQASAGGREVEVLANRLDPRLRLVACDAPLTVAQGPGAKQIGYTSVSVRCEGVNPWSLFVPVVVRERIPVVVATTALPAGKILGPHDTKLESQWVLDGAQQVVRSPDGAVGRITVRQIAAGEVLLQGALRTVRAVRRGEIVVLALEQGPVAIHMGGTAMQDGAVGERIQVRNATSRRVVEGTILEPGLVVVR
ncbi:MAG: flagellar basal body P-ring formation protein FlgA [Gammaproteobacteria bacterium]|nr:flagellar basal body P-ring formation protein FlgA [Gammaproteobacteria bacterium]